MASSPGGAAPRLARLDAVFEAVALVEGAAAQLHLRDVEQQLQAVGDALATALDDAGDEFPGVPVEGDAGRRPWRRTWWRPRRRCWT